jgi:hypothetical protein
MLDKTEYSRLLIKRTNTTGASPTIPPVSAVTLSQFTPTDVMVGEFFLNTVDDELWIRTENDIYPILLSGGQITGVTGNFEIISGQTWTELYSGETGAALTLDWDNGNVQEWHLTASTEVSFINGKAGATYVVNVKQSNTSGYTVTWNPADIFWQDGIAPTMTPTANAYDVYTFVYNGVFYLGSYVQNFQPSIAPTTTTTTTAAPSIVTDGLLTFFDGTNSASISGAGDTTWVSISGATGATATLNNGAAYNSAFGGGVYFDGTNDFARTDVNILNVADFTLEIWTTLNSSASGYARWYGSDGSNFEFASSGLEMAFYTPSDGWVNTGVNNVIETPYHLVVTYDLETNTLIIYRNSTEVYRSTTIEFTPGGSFSEFAADSSDGSNLPCYIYKLRTYNKPLSSSEVLNNWDVEKSNYGY